ncbi:hypothetical protein Y1Q_0008859 [Alligator mississippiensis]|uniref:Uncharacterized protein n=1 Tax=Alligator mississippiensis TaxID=8496 RepID=A0A151NA76_ALLMI|nr:hypothetical protein Y1Q_0008859 [Alligator mississippiensis]
MARGSSSPSPGLRQRRRSCPRPGWEASGRVALLGEDGFSLAPDLRRGRSSVEAGARISPGAVCGYDYWIASHLDLIVER